MTDSSAELIGKVLEGLEDFERLEKKKQVEGLTETETALWGKSYSAVLDELEPLSGQFIQEREFVRIPYRCSVVIWTDDAAQEARTTTFCCGGVSVPYQDGLKEGEVYKITLSLNKHFGKDEATSITVNLRAKCEWASEEDGLTAFRFSKPQPQMRIFLIERVFEVIDEKLRKLI
jgi:c-di-GMP-binding flagellar brake protein YcgR